MPRVPPVVQASLIEGGVAYLIEWVRLPVDQGGGWGARIAWVMQNDDGAWFLKGGVVPAGDVKPIDGQNYKTVPRDPRPSDPSDPRDPKSRRYERDQAYMAALSRAARARDPSAANWDDPPGPF